MYRNAKHNISHCYRGQTNTATITTTTALPLEMHR